MPSTARILGMLGRARAAAAATSNSGVASTTPIASPIHHDGQTTVYRCPGRAPVTTRAAVPSVALTVMHASPPIPITASTSAVLSIVTTGRRSTNRIIITARTGARVLPTVISAEVSMPEPLRRLAASAPNATPGHRRRPPSSKAATAMPVGGQIGVTLLFANARPRLSLPLMA